MVRTGLTLQPDDLFLDLLDGIAREHADYYEVAPETLWAEGEGGELVPNRYHRRLARLARETGKPFVAHAVGLSLASASADEARWQRWRARFVRDAAQFGFSWFTDHLGASSIAGQNATLPLPVPMTAFAASRVQTRLREVQRLVPDVGVENVCHYFMPDDPLREPSWINRIVAAPRMHLLLDLHNLHAMALNFGFEPQAYLAALDLDRVIEIHVAGGAESDAGWLPDGATLRLDGHDGAVPEAVWSLLAQVAPRCRNLRGVTLERMEGTVDASAVPLIRAELARIRQVLAA